MSEEVLGLMTTSIDLEILGLKTEYTAGGVLGLTTVFKDVEVLGLAPELVVVVILGLKQLERLFNVSILTLLKVPTSPALFSIAGKS